MIKNGMNSFKSEPISRSPTEKKNTGGILGWIERAQSRIAKTTGESNRKGLLLIIDSLTRVADTRRLSADEQAQLASAQKSLRQLSGVE